MDDDAPVREQKTSHQTKDTSKGAGGAAKVEKRGPEIDWSELNNFSRKVGRKLAKWTLFGVGIASLPIIGNYISMWVGGDEITKVELLSDGELSIVAAGVAAAGIGDLIYDRDVKVINGVQASVIGFCILMAFSAAFVYKDIKSNKDAVDPTRSSFQQLPAAEKDKALADHEIEKKRAADASMGVYVGALIASIGCIVASERFRPLRFKKVSGGGG